MIFSLILLLKSQGLLTVRLTDAPVILGIISGGAVIYWCSGASMQAVSNRWRLEKCSAAWFSSATCFFQRRWLAESNSTDSDDVDSGNTYCSWESSRYV